MSTTINLSITPPLPDLSSSGSIVNSPSGSSSGSSTSSLGTSSREKGSFEFSAESSKESMIAIAPITEPALSGSTQVISITQAAQLFRDTLTSESELRKHTPQGEKDGFTATQGARLLLRWLELNPFRRLLKAKDRLDLNIEKEIEKMLVEAAQCNSHHTDAVYEVVGTILEHMLTIVPINFYGEVIEKTVPRRWSLLCFGGDKTVIMEQAAIIFGVRFESVHSPDRLFRHAFAFQVRPFKTHTITDYESMREPISKVTSLANCLRLVTSGQEFEDKTKNTPSGVISFLHSLTQDYYLIQSIGYYHQGRPVIKETATLPRQKGAVQTRFFSKAEVKDIETKVGAIHKKIWPQPVESGYAGGPTLSYDTQLLYGKHYTMMKMDHGLIFRATKNNPAEDRLLFLMFQDALTVIVHGGDPAAYRQVVDVLWTGAATE